MLKRCRKAPGPAAYVSFVCRFSRLALALTTALVSTGCRKVGEEREASANVPEQPVASRDSYKVRDTLAGITADLTTAQYADGLAVLQSIAVFREFCEMRLSAFSQANSEVEALELKAAEPPSGRPARPKLSDHQEVRRMCGTVRGTYVSGEGGIVVIQGGEYYVINGAAPAFFSQVCGYVRDEGFEITLDNGHTAHSVMVSDVIEYKEDLAKANESLREAMVDYKKELQRWQEAQKPGYVNRHNDDLTRLYEARVRRTELLAPLKECGSRI